MFESTPSLADIAAVTKDNDGFGGNNGWWILIILFAIFGGWGNGSYGNNNCVGTNGIASTADVQRGFDNTEVNNKLNTIGNGIADLGYAVSNQFAAAELSRQNLQGALMGQLYNNSINDLQNYNAMQSALQNCCCQNREAIAQVRFDNATNTCAITTAINNAAQQIMQNDNANYRLLHDENVAMQLEAKNDKIADLQTQIQALNLTASQVAQNAYLISQLKTTTATA